MKGTKFIDSISSSSLRWLDEGIAGFVVVVVVVVMVVIVVMAVVVVVCVIVKEIRLDPRDRDT